MLNQGIRLSGENQEYFIRGRLDSLQSRLPRDFKVRRVLDFGCGIGITTGHLVERFQGAEVVGDGYQREAHSYARTTWNSNRVRFPELEDLSVESDFDLCYVNGVFHHIAPAERTGAVADDLSGFALTAGGWRCLRITPGIPARGW